MQTQQAISNVYQALDDLGDLLPGWRKKILQASEPMFALLDRIESLTNLQHADDSSCGNPKVNQAIPETENERTTRATDGTEEITTEDLWR